MKLSIPDAAAELAVSESRLRRTLQEIAVPTATELRQTRTGVRKTTVLDESAMARLSGHFSSASLQDQTNCADFNGRAAAFVCPDAGSSDSVRGSDDRIATPITPDCAPQFCAPDTQSVPLAQFNALLYQHNVLRQELSRVTDYLDGCDRLLGEMVRTIATLEERTQRLDPARAPGRVANPLAGALRTVTAGFQSTLFARMAAKPSAPSADVFYGGALAGQ